MNGIEFYVDLKSDSVISGHLCNCVHICVYLYNYVSMNTEMYCTIACTYVHMYVHTVWRKIFTRLKFRVFRDLIQFATVYSRNQ